MRTLSLLLAGLLGGASLAAQESDQRSTIYANAGYPYRVDADAVEFQVIVEGRGNSAAQAASPCAGAVDSVTATLRRLGIAALTFDVVAQGVAPVTSPYGQPTPGERFLARTTIRVRLTDLRHLPRVTAAVLDAGAARTAMFQWSAHGIEGIRRVALDSALVRAAREAEQMAKVLGGQLGRLHHATSGEGNSYNNYYTGQDNTVQSTPEVRGTMTADVTYAFVRPLP
jgi:uncharacterized protein YggE